MGDRSLAVPLFLTFSSSLASACAGPNVPLEDLEAARRAKSEADETDRFTGLTWMGDHGAYLKDGEEAIRFDFRWAGANTLRELEVRPLGLEVDDHPPPLLTLRGNSVTSSFQTEAQLSLVTEAFAALEAGAQALEEGDPHFEPPPRPDSVENVCSLIIPLALLSCGASVIGAIVVALARLLNRRLFSFAIMVGPPAERVRDSAGQVCVPLLVAFAVFCRAPRQPNREPSSDPSDRDDEPDEVPPLSCGYLEHNDAPGDAMGLGSRIEASPGTERHAITHHDGLVAPADEDWFEIDLSATEEDVFRPHVSLELTDGSTQYQVCAYFRDAQPWSAPEGEHSCLEGAKATGPGQTPGCCTGPTTTEQDALPSYTNDTRIDLYLDELKHTYGFTRGALLVHVRSAPHASRACVPYQLSVQL